MKLGAQDKRKVIALSALLLVAGYLVYTNLLSDPAPSAPSAPNPAAQRSADPDAAPASAPSAPAASSSAPARRAGGRNPKNDEFHPVFRARNSQGEAPLDAMAVDPTIHIDLLAKVQDAKMEGGQRNLFQFGAAPPGLNGPEPIVKPKPVAQVYDYPRPFVPKPPEPKPAGPPPPPPSFKYYGLATRRINNQRTAFFLDGEDIILATEGMTVKGRWRLVRIGSESVMLEDNQTKKQQPMAISEEAGGTP